MPPSSLKPAPMPGVTPPTQFAEAIAEIEKELDARYPAWREPVNTRRGPGSGFKGSMGLDAKKQPELKARVKYLLQRRKHLYDGEDVECRVHTWEKADGTIGMVAYPLRQRRAVTPESVAAAALAPLDPA